MPKYIDAYDDTTSQSPVDYANELYKNSVSSKTDSLYAAKEEKLNRLVGGTTPSWVDTSMPNQQEEYATSKDGVYYDHYGNKIANNLSSSEKQYLLGKTYNDYGIHKTAEGYKQKDADGNLVDYTGDIDDNNLPAGYSMLYLFGTQNNGERVKLGTWGGSENAEDRYGSSLTEDKYDNAIGPEGVNYKDKQMELLLPRGMVDTFENLFHGNEEGLQSRTLRAEAGNIDKYKNEKSRFGTGVTEMYDSKLGAFGDSRDDAQFDEDKLLSDFIALSGYSTGTGTASEETSLDNFEQEVKKNASESMDVFDIMDNVAKAFGVGASKSAYDFADTTVELIGDLAARGIELGSPEAAAYVDKNLDLATDKEKTEQLNELWKYNDYRSSVQMEKVAAAWNKATENVSLFDPSTWLNMDVGELATAAGEAFADIETSAYSLGYMTVALLGVVGKATKKLLSEGLQETSSIVESIAKSGATRAEKKAATKEVISKLSVADRTKLLVINNADVMAMGAMMNNNQLDTYMENNGGEEATLARQLTGFVANSVGMKFDLGFANSALKGKGALNSYLTKVFSTTDKGTASKMVAGSLQFATRAAAAGLKEAPQEWGQTFIESFNQVYGTKDENGNEIGAFDTAEQAVSEANVGALYGAAGGAHMSMGGQTVNMLVDAAKGGSVALTKRASDAATKYSASKDVDTTPVETKEERKEVFKTAVRELHKEHSTGVTADNVSTLQSKLDKISQYRDSVDDTTNVPLLQKTDALIGKIANDVQKAIEANPEMKITGKILGSSEAVEYSPKEKEAIAEQIMHTTLGSSSANTDDFKVKLKTFAKANGVTDDKTDAIIKSYESVREEGYELGRGVLVREAKLKRLLSSGSPDVKEIKKEVDEITSFHTATSKSKRNLQEGIISAESKAKELNHIDKTTNKVYKDRPKSVKITTEYLKDEKDSNGKRVPFTMYVSYDMDSKKWKADTKIAEKNITLKKDLEKQLARVLTENNSSILNSVGEGSDAAGFSVPEPSLGVSKGIASARSRDVTRLKKAREALEEYGYNGDVNKVIVDDNHPKNHSEKWKDGGDYKKLNIGTINTHNITGAEYSADDVVLINSEGTHKVGNFPMANILSNNNPVKEELNAAIAAGATIVLDRETVEGNIPGKVSIMKYLKDKGYKSLPESGVMVKDSEELTAKLEVAKERNVAKEKAAKEKDRTLASLADMKADEISGGVAIDKAKYEELKAKVREYYKGDDIEGKLDRSIATIIKNRVAAVVESLEREDGPNDRHRDSKAINAIAEKQYANSVNEDSRTKELLEYWSELGANKKLSNSDIASNLESKALELGLDIELSGKAKELLDFSTSKGRPKVYEKLYRKEKQDTKGNWITEEFTKTVAMPTKKPTKEEVQKFLNSDTKYDKTGTSRKTPVSYKEVTTDVNDIVTVASNTVVNSIESDKLPTVIKLLGEGFLKALKKVIPDITEFEKASTEDYAKAVVKSKINKTNESLYLYDSPARGLLITKAGISPEVATAMALAVLDTLTTDKRKLLKGYKNKEDIADLFNVQPHEVTKEMQEFVKDIGAFRKTVATSIGKNVAKQLGLKNKNSSDVGYATYIRLIADLGNMAIEAAIQQGLIENVSKSSKDMQKLYKDKSTDYVSSNATTSFINIVSTKEDKKYTPVQKVVDELAKFEKAAELVPEIKNKETGPRLDPLSSKEIKSRLEHVRNDDIGIAVPQEAKETLKTMMNTEFSISLDTADEFLDLYNNNKEDISKQLGYIEIDSDAYNMLSFDEKDVQQAKNDAMEDSIKYLTEFVETNRDSAVDGEVSMYFPFSYINNGRYHLDSNTVNPQGDKLHRFLVNMKKNKRTYKYNSSDGTFVSNGKKVSLLVRIAIAQAFGMGVDKEVTTNIIEYGNAMLSLSESELVELKKEIVTKGKTEVTVDGEEYKIEAEHLTHTLQGFNFLEQLAKGEEVTSYLSAEFDSLTSGFANKVQQMPILGSLEAPIEDDSNMVMHEYLARVGVITSYYEANVLSGLDGELGKTKAMNDVLGGVEGFLDSYKSLAKKSVLGLRDAAEALSNSAKTYENRLGELFIDMTQETSVLPGHEVVKMQLDGHEVDPDTVVISSDMRSMFKNPFMIFNYSAGIPTIRKNLGANIASDMLSEISKSNLKDDKGAELITFILDNYKLSIGDKSITTAKGLQDAVRNSPTYALTVGSLRGDRKFGNLHKDLSAISEAVYGSVLENVFKEEFTPYIDIQNSTNDAFKVMFRVFDSKRRKLLKAVIDDKGFYSEEDLKSITDTLWTDFPHIMGPLSDSNSSKEVIPVVSKKLGSPSEVTESAKSAQTRVINGNTIVVHPLLREIDEAYSAGSVVPYHFIDGAEMAKMFNDFKSSVGNSADMLGIHDAYITALTEVDSSLESYGKGMHEINDSYFILGEVNNMLKRMDTEGVDLKAISSKGLHSTRGTKSEETILFDEALKNVVADIESKTANVLAYRDKWKDALATAKNGNIVGTPAGMSSKGSKQFDYESEFERQGIYNSATGETTLYLKNINMDDVGGVFYHELGVHAYMDTMSSDEVSGIKDRAVKLLRSGLSSKTPKIRKFFQKVENRLILSGTLQDSEEVLAYIIEEGVNQNIGSTFDSLMESLNSISPALKNVVESFINIYGKMYKALTDKEIVKEYKELEKMVIQGAKSLADSKATKEQESTKTAMDMFNRLKNGDLSFSIKSIESEVENITKDCK